MAGASGLCRQASKQYLLWCANQHIEFRIPELKSIASMLSIPIKWIDKPREDPYVIVELRCESDAKKLMSRSLLVRSCYELWGQGDTEAELHSNIQSYPVELTAPHLHQDKTFRICVDTFNKTLKSTEKLARIESLAYLPFKGRVDLKNADTRLHLIEYYGLHPNHTPPTPYKVFLGRWVAEGQRELINRYSLKQRCFIGNTSMDAELAFIMTNLAQVRPGEVVADPFVGTGSILVSAAHWGGQVLGWDIDYLTLHARTKPTRFSQKHRTSAESIAHNLDQYGLGRRYLDVAVMDNAHACWRDVHFVDAIVTDPPYGIRESTERVGSQKTNATKDANCTIPASQQQSLNNLSVSVNDSLDISKDSLDISKDLLDISKDSLDISNGQLDTSSGQLDTSCNDRILSSDQLSNVGNDLSASNARLSNINSQLTIPDDRLSPSNIDALSSSSNQMASNDQLSNSSTSSETFTASHNQLKDISTTSSNVPGSSLASNDNTTPSEEQTNLDSASSRGGLTTEEAPSTSSCSASVPVERKRGYHYPTKVSYSLSDIFRDLLNFAASHLVVGGRLVFWMPVFREDYDECQVPSHACLQLVYNCEQVLTVHSSRRLITLIKTRHPMTGESATGQVMDVNAEFRERFFQACNISKEERASLKSQFPRDKRGQGLGYRLEEARNKDKIKDKKKKRENRERIVNGAPMTESDEQKVAKV